MKLTFKSLIALMLLICTVFAISSCGVQAPRDLEDAADNLEDEDYYVTYIDDEDDLGLGIVEYLSATDEDDENHITVIVFDSSKTAKLYYNTLKLEFDQKIEDIKNEIEYCKSEIKYYEHVLKKYDDDLSSKEIDRYEEYIEEYEDEIKELEKELEEIKKESVLKCFGKKVWFGTKDAFKDAKG